MLMMPYYGPHFRSVGKAMLFWSGIEEQYVYETRIPTLKMNFYYYTTIVDNSLLLYCNWCAYGHVAQTWLKGKSS